MTFLPTLSTAFYGPARRAVRISMPAMKTKDLEWSIATEERYGFVDVTDELQELVASSGVTDGRATVFSPSDTCPILVNERESGLLRDIRRAVDRVTQSGDHSPPTTLGAKSVVFPVVDGRLRLGMWQRILLFELDEPRERSVVVQIVGDRDE